MASTRYADRVRGRPSLLGHSALRDRLPPHLIGLLTAALLAAIYLIVRPPSADLAAAAHRSSIFSTSGALLWDNSWYAGQALPAYSLLSPELGAWIGLRPLLALSAVIASVLYGLISARLLSPGAARASTIAFAFGFCAELPSGRVPYDVGAAIGLSAVLSALEGRRSLTCALSALTSLASPVAGAFLAMCGLALFATSVTEPASRTALRGTSRTASRGVWHTMLRGASRKPSRGGPITPPRGTRRTTSRRGRATQGLAICAAGLLPILLLAAAFPNGGSEPFAGGAFWPELLAALAVAALLPRGSFSAQAARVVKVGAALYAIALTASFLIATPMGGNAARMGEMFGAPLVIAAVWGAGARRFGSRARSPSGSSLARLGSLFEARSRSLLRGRKTRLAAAALLLGTLLYWQLATSIKDQLALAGDKTVEASFYAPLRHELLTLAKGSPIRVEVPLTGAHWESDYLPGGPISIARGWDRQLDIRYAHLFYGKHVSAAAYRRWLSEEAVSYVALPAARLDGAGRQEARLIEAGLPYLRQLWHTPDWRLFAVVTATPLVQRPATMRRIGVESFAMYAPRPGSYLVHLHWTPYWRPAEKDVCVREGPDGLTVVDAKGRGLLAVRISFSLRRLFEGGEACG